MVCGEREGVREGVLQPPYGRDIFPRSLSYRVAEGKARAWRAAGRMAKVKTRLSMVVVGWGGGGGGGCAWGGVWASCGLEEVGLTEEKREERGGRAKK